MHLRPHIELTARAAEEFRDVIAAEGRGLDGSAIRVGMEFRHGRRTHSLELVFDWSEPDDAVAESHGIRLVCRSADRELLRGTTIDYCDDERGRGFVVQRSTMKVDAAQIAEYGPPEEQAVRDALKQVIDPEIGLNIVDLGLVYRVEIADRRVHLTMTMTTPACPLSAQIEDDARRSIHERCPGTSEVEIKLVWNPRWSPQMMSDEAKEQMGWGWR